jgi:hypothetical protein
MLLHHGRMSPHATIWLDIKQSESHDCSSWGLMGRIIKIALAGVLGIWNLAGCATHPSVGLHERPIRWAQPVTLPGPPTPNLYQVAHNFYRSAQPDRSGFENVARRLKIRTVISLRAYHSDKSLLSGLQIQSYDIKMHTWHIETEDVVAALRILRQSVQRGPTLLHCEHGADRTGLVTALYRVVYQNWCKKEALAEMEGGGFGYHDVWFNIPDYFMKTDIEQLRKAVGVNRRTKCSAYNDAGISVPRDD